MQQGLAQQRRFQHAPMPALPITQLASLRGRLQTFAQTGWHALAMPLHRSRSKEAARMLRRYHNLVTPARSDRETFVP